MRVNPNMFDSITPVILTYNEAPNIARTLEKLNWAKDIVVVDSYSTDDTISIVAGFPQARTIQRKFDSHSEQWNFALNETGIKTEWVLALDADYVLSDCLVDELAALIPSDETAGYKAQFIYCVYGKSLRGAGYPPVTVLYRRSRAAYRQDGHTQRVVIEGKIEDLRSPIFHDDRKPLGHWLAAQNRYMELEVNKLTNEHWNNLCWADRLRKMRFIFPFIMLGYCLFIKGGILDGRAGLYYALQRTVAECILSLQLLQRDTTGIRDKADPLNPIDRTS